MRALVTGAGGLLAGALRRELESRDWESAHLARTDLDVTAQPLVDAAVDDLKPEVVFHCAAYTKVDLAEEQEPEALRVNRGGAACVGRACARNGALIVFPSTDYVFSGDQSRPYLPTDKTGPTNAYGRSKLAGEAAVIASGARHIIGRTSWLFGSGGENFVDSIVALGRTRERLSVVNDQTGRPTWTTDLARALADLAEKKLTGVFHVAGGGWGTWQELAEEALQIEGLTTVVEPISTEAFGAAAPRPRYSVLDISDTEAALGRRMPDWRSSLRRYLEGESL